MSMFEGFENLIFPYGLKCPLCEGVRLRSSDPLCKACRKEIAEGLQGLHPCAKCGRFIPLDSQLCQDCKTVNLFPFNIARGAAPYKGILKEKIHLFKYFHKRSLAEPLALLMVKVFKEEKQYAFVDGVVAVPLHFNRLEERTFNQAEELAKIVAAKLKLNYIEGALWRVVDTTTQVNLNRKQRMLNLGNAFSVPNPDLVKDKRLLLIDDIFTTGTTVSECTRVLLKAGASRVAVLTLASGKALNYQKN